MYTDILEGDLNHEVYKHRCDCHKNAIHNAFALSLSLRGGPEKFSDSLVTMGIHVIQFYQCDVRGKSLFFRGHTSGKPFCTCPLSSHMEYR